MNVDTPVRQFVCSATAGLLATVISHPFDTIAVHLATRRPMPRSLGELFYGVGPAAFQGLLVYGSLIQVYETLIDWGWPVLLAAAVAAIPESIVRGPMQAIQNMQQTGFRPRGAAYLWTLVQGSMGTLAREMPGNLVYFPTYNFVRARGYASWVAGAATGAAYTVAVYPIEAMRSQLVTGKPIRPTYQGSGPYFVKMVILGLFVQFFYTALIGPPPQPNLPPSTCCCCCCSPSSCSSSCCCCCGGCCCCERASRASQATPRARPSRSSTARRAR